MHARRFDAPRFYGEARRILKPGGVLAAWTYGVPVVEHAGHPAQAALLQLYSGVRAAHARMRCQQLHPPARTRARMHAP